MNEMLAQFNLPTYINGLSFAEASTKIQSKYKGRTDRESVETEKEMLGRLKGMQEHVKEQQAQKEQAQQQAQRDPSAMVAGEMSPEQQGGQQGGQHQMPDGSSMPDSEMGQQEPQQAPQDSGDFMNQIQNAYGGKMNEYALGGEMMQREQPMAQRYMPTRPSGDQSISDSISSFASTLDSTSEDSQGSEDGMGSNMFELGGPEDDYYKNNNPYFMNDPGQVHRTQGREEGLSPEIMNQVSAIGKPAPMGPSPSTDVIGASNANSKDGTGKPGAAGYAQMAATAVDLGQTAFGPTGIDTSGRERVEKSKAGIGAFSGAAKGASAGMALGPWGAAAGAVIGGAAGFIGSKKQQRDAQIANVNATYAEASQNDNQFADGGDIGPGDKDKIDPKKKGSVARGTDTNTYDYDQIGNRALSDSERASINQGTGIQFTPEFAESYFSGNRDPAKPTPPAVDYSKLPVQDITSDGLFSDRKVWRTGRAEDFLNRDPAVEGEDYTRVPYKGWKEYQGGEEYAKYKGTNAKAMGGEVNMFVDGGYDKKTGKFIKPSMSGSQDDFARSIMDIGASQKSINQAREDKSVYGDKVSSAKSIKEMTQYADDNQMDFRSGYKKFLEKAKGSQEALRYAPALMNMEQLSSFKDTEGETTGRLGNRYEKQLTDEQALQNLVKGQASANREALLGATGGSDNAARANLIASELNSTKALSDAYMRSSEANRAEARQEQSFNLNVDSTNLQQDNLAQDIRARNRDADRNEKSKLKSAIANDLGAIGQEELYRKFPELMGSDYNSRGKYQKKKKTT